MKNKIHNQSGIALMIVLAAVTLLTATATEFAYNTNVNYHLALNEKERTQAYFLASSAVRLMQLELKMERQAKSALASSAFAQYVSGDMSGPLCQQFPLSTALLRSLFLGEMPEGLPGGGEEGEEGEAEEGERAAFIGGLEAESAKEFLRFEGDFEGACEDEAAKFNLNVFVGKDPMKPVLSGFNDYDKSKQLLFTLLMRPEFEELFPEERETAINEIVRNIADWVDTNDRVNEVGGTSTGSESSLYTAPEIQYEVKNAKILTLDELYKIAGVTDDWFTPIMDRFTIYGGSKVNVCLASDDVVAALIIQYANNNPNIADVNPTDKERMSSLVSTVKMGCTGVTPNVDQIAKGLDAALGVGSATGTEGADAKKTGTGGIASLITTDSRFYTLVGTGVVGETEVNIRTVLDTKDAHASRWKYLYWKVE